MFPIRRAQQQHQNDRRNHADVSSNPNNIVRGTSVNYNSNRNNVVIRGTAVVPTVPIVSTTNRNNATMNYNSIGDDKFHQQVEYLIPATVRMISGCHSEQTSADVRNTSIITDKINNSKSKNSKVGSVLPNSYGKAGGACTSALLDILYQNYNQQRQQEKSNTNLSSTLSVQSLLLQLRQKLSERGFTQIPQLSSSRPLDINDDPWNLTGNGSVNQSSRTITGKRQDGTGGISRALLVGINYTGQYPGELNGCQNDVWNMYKYLVDIEGYNPNNILVLVDSSNGRSNTNNQNQHQPTRATILHALQQLVQQSKPNDTVYFHFSGHGGLLDPDFNDFKKQLSTTLSSILPSRNRNSTIDHKTNDDGTVTDQYDETIYPVDHKTAGHIRDYSLYKNFVQPMAAGVLVTCVMDCCHSGSVLKLPYTYQPTSGDGYTTIRSITNMDYLTNLAFFYTLMGHTLPIGTGLFDNIISNFEQTTGNSLTNYIGNGIDETLLYDDDNGVDTDNVNDSINYDNANDGDNDDNEATVSAYDENDNNIGSYTNPFSSQRFDPNNDNTTDRVYYDDTVDQSASGMDCGGCLGGLLGALLHGSTAMDADDDDDDGGGFDVDYDDF
jgi:metacaspase-1